jgi:hypothetical protein
VFGRCPEHGLIGVADGGRVAEAHSLVAVVPSQSDDFCAGWIGDRAVLWRHTGPASPPEAGVREVLRPLAWHRSPSVDCGDATDEGGTLRRSEAGPGGARFGPGGHLRTMLAKSRR